MKIRKFRPFHFDEMAKHEKWLADMARQGWRYKGAGLFGFQYFEQGTPAEMVFSWDQAPRAKQNALDYREKCRKAGWEMASSTGRWLCWSKAAVPGQPAEPLRDKASTLALFLDIQRQYALQVMLMVAILFFQFPALAGKGRLSWPTIAVLVFAAAAAIMNMFGALRARTCVRQLDPQQR